MSDNECDWDFSGRDDAKAEIRAAVRIRGHVSNVPSTDIMRMLRHIAEFPSSDIAFAPVC
jgi:hypothetical protein